MNATRPALADPIATTATDSLPLPSDAVEEIRTFQAAARRIVRDPSLTFVQAAMAILNLVREARKAEAPEWAVEAILSEACGYVSGGPRPMDRQTIVEELAASDPVDAALRRLLRDGYARCPTCTRLLPDERALDHRRTLARASLEDALLREEAV